jgi:hypothetical protein
MHYGAIDANSDTEEVKIPRLGFQRLSTRHNYDWISSPTPPSAWKRYDVPSATQPPSSLPKPRDFSELSPVERIKYFALNDRLSLVSSILAAAVVIYILAKFVFFLSAKRLALTVGLAFAAEPSLPPIAPALPRDPYDWFWAVLLAIVLYQPSARPTLH